MYGAVRSGGLNNNGGVFRYDITSGQYELLFSFDSNTGFDPSKVAVVAEVVYGIMNSGGVNNEGTVYKYDIANQQLSILKDFGVSELNGSSYGFIKHSNGKLYAELERYPGGILEVDPATDAVVQKVSFGDYNLRQNNGGHISGGSDGRIYGTVGRLSGSGRGLYAYDPATDTFDDLFAPSYVQNINNFQALAVCIAPLSEPIADTTLCAGAPLSIGVNSFNSTSYTWKKDGAVLSGQTTDSLKIDAVSTTDAGTYTVVLKNACGSDSVSFVLGVSDIQLSATAVDVQCHGGEDGSISVDAQGGIAPYEYSLDGVDFQSEATFADLAAGDYVITVKDANGCIAGVEAMVGQPDVLLLTTTGQDQTCELGSIAITANGGVGPYEYSLDGQSYQGESQLNGLAAGGYTVYVRDANGCVATEAHTVGMVAPLLLTATISESTEYPENGSIALDISGGAEPYGITWGTGDSTATISDLVPNDYTVTVTDGNGCSVDSTFTVGGVTSIADLEQQGILVYPNPVVDQLQIQLPVASDVHTATLYNSQGELVRKFSLQGGVNRLKTEGLPPSVYLLQLSNGTTTRIMIK